MSWLSDLFSPKKKEAPAVSMPYQDPSIALAKKSLEDLIAQRGYYKESEMGYTPSVISSTTAPYATARRANYQSYEVPQISAEASARGLGRSTIPVNRIALSGQEAERDIEQRIADMVQRSEALKAAQKSENASIYQNAISGLTGIGTQQVGAQNQANLYAADALNTNRAAGNQRAVDTAKIGAGAVLSLLTANPTPLLATMSSSYNNYDNNALMNILSKLKGGANVNIAGQTV